MLAWRALLCSRRMKLARQTIGMAEQSPEPRHRASLGAQEIPLPAGGRLLSRTESFRAEDSGKFPPSKRACSYESPFRQSIGPLARKTFDLCLEVNLDLAPGEIF